MRCLLPFNSTFFCCCCCCHELFVFSADLSSQITAFACLKSEKHVPRRWLCLLFSILDAHWSHFPFNRLWPQHLSRCACVFILCSHATMRCRTVRDLCARPFAAAACHRTFNTPVSMQTDRHADGQTDRQRDEISFILDTTDSGVDFTAE